jgi:hypothetical protein
MFPQLKDKNWRSDRKRSWPNLRYYAEICLEEVRKSTRICVRIVGVSADIRTGHIPNIIHNNYLQSQLFRPDVYAHLNKLNVTLQGNPLFMHELQAYTAVHLQNRLLLFSKQVNKNNFTHSSTL